MTPELRERLHHKMRELGWTTNGQTSDILDMLEEELKSVLVTSIMIDVAPGEDGEGKEIYAKSVDDVVNLLTQMSEKIEAVEGSQPAAQAVEPVAWAIFTENGNARMWSTFQPHVQKLADAEGLTVTPLYTAQPQAQPLTDEQALRCIRMAVHGNTLRLTRDVGPYEVTELTPDARRLIDALIAEAGGIGTEGGAR